MARLSLFRPATMIDHATGPERHDARGVTERLKQLIAVGIALTSEQELPRLLERIVAEARHFTNAETGTLFLRDNDVLRFAVARHDPRLVRTAESDGQRPVVAEALKRTPLSLAEYVALNGQLVNLPHAFNVSPTSKPCAPDGRPAALASETTGSVLVVPLQEPRGDVIGVLQLINARNEAGDIVPFAGELEALVQALASQAAVAIRNARLEELSFKDPLTGIYNRRYFALRIEEEARRHARFGEPLSLVLLDLDRFKNINDEMGHRAGDDTLREAAQLIVASSRSFSVVTRYGGDEFAVLLVNTPKSGAVKYAHRIKDVVERHRFVHGPLTVSVGIAALPEDVTRSDDLVPAADRALYAAKRSGRNLIEIA
jgi:diguanylate cyclase (GGDEF)-like protein